MSSVGEVVSITNSIAVAAFHTRSDLRHRTDTLYVPSARVFVIVFTFQTLSQVVPLSNVMS